MTGECLAYGRKRTLATGPMAALLVAAIGSGMACSCGAEAGTLPATPGPTPAIPHPSGVPEQRIIDLATALQLASNGHFDILAARLRVAEAAAKSSAASWGLLPTIGLGASISRTAGQAQSSFGQLQGADFHTVGDLGVVTLSLNAGESAYRDLAARQALDAEARFSDATALRTVAAVTQRYLDLVESFLAVRYMEASVTDTTSLVHLAEVRESQGSGSALDTARARTQLAAAEQRLIWYRNERQRRAKDLAGDLRLDGLIDLVPADQDVSPAALIDAADPLDLWLQRAHLHRPEAEGLADAQRAAREDASAARWGAWGPSVVLSAGYGQLGTTVGNLDEREGWSVGLNWTLSAAAFGRIDAAEVRAAQAGLAGQRFAEQLRLAIEKTFQEVQLLREQLEPSQRELDSAEQALRIAKARFTGGVLPATEFLLAQQAADEARVRRVSTVIHYNQAQTRLLGEAGIGSAQAMGCVAAPSAPAGSRPPSPDR